MQRRVGTVQHVDVSEERLTSSPWNLLLLESALVFLPHGLLVLFLYALWQILHKVHLPMSFFAGIGDMLLGGMHSELIGSLALMLILFAAFRMMMGTGSPRDATQTLFYPVVGALLHAMRLVFGFVLLFLRGLWRSCRHLADRLRQMLLFRGVLRERTIPVRTIELMENPHSRFHIRIRGEILQGGIGMGQTLEVEGMDRNGAFVPRRIWNRSFGNIEIRWRNQERGF